MKNREAIVFQPIDMTTSKRAESHARDSLLSALATEFVGARDRITEI